MKFLPKKFFNILSQTTRERTAKAIIELQTMITSMPIQTELGKISTVDFKVDVCSKKR